MSITSQSRIDAYKQFFIQSEVGQDFMKQLRQLEKANIRTAQSNNSLDYLSRSTGTREVIDLIENALNSERKPKE